MANQLNAYELADQLDNVKYQNGAKPFEMYANMLRQQADRIAEFEKQGKPVAWMSPDGKVSQTEGRLFYIPLYTTPQTKPLSNDEILEMTIWNKNLYELYVEMDKEDMIAFARAIEERHGIK